MKKKQTAAERAKKKKHYERILKNSGLSKDPFRAEMELLHRTESAQDMLAMRAIYRLKRMALENMGGGQ